MQIKKIFMAILVMFLFVSINNIRAETKTTTTTITKEEITNFDVVQTLQQDSSILAEEKITFYCGDAVIQNGLVRTFSKQIVDNEKKVSNLVVSAFSLKLDGKEEKFSVQEDTSSIYVYMGDTAKKLAKGTHIFVLTYKINGIINTYSYNYNKYFYFPLGGWDLPVERATIKIKVPAGKNITLLQPKIFKEVATENTFSETVFYLTKAPLDGELLLIPKDPIIGGDILALSIIIPKNFVKVAGTKNFYFSYWGFYLFSASLLLFSLYVFFRKKNNEKWYIFSRSTILLTDFLTLFFIFNKENADMIFGLFTIFLLLAIEIILTTRYEGINKSFIIFKYVTITIAIIFYCFGLFSFAYKIQGLILLLIIISQILFLNKKKETR